MNIKNNTIKCFDRLPTEFKEKLIELDNLHMSSVMREDIFEGIKSVIETGSKYVFVKSKQMFLQKAKQLKLVSVVGYEVTEEFKNDYESFLLNISKYEEFLDAYQLKSKLFVFIRPDHIRQFPCDEWYLLIGI